MYARSTIHKNHTEWTKRIERIEKRMRHTTIHFAAGTWDNLKIAKKGIIQYMDISRADALQLLKEYIHSPALLQHCYAVEAIMRHFAQDAKRIADCKESYDEEYWGLVGLLHDLDWEKFPDEHCNKTALILAEAGYPDSFIYSVRSHGWTICTDDEPKLFMEKVLFTCDELSGLIVASALVRPSKSLSDIKVSSVMKKWKTPAFAAGVNREIILKGAGMLNLELTSLIEECIAAMRPISKNIGLQ